MRNFIDFEDEETARQFAETYDGQLTIVRNGENTYYRVYYYKD